MALFNPQQVSISKSVNWNRVPVAESDVSRAQFTHGEPSVLHLELLFDISQPALSKHLKKLRDVGLIDVERRGVWAYYYVKPEALEELKSWLS